MYTVISTGDRTSNHNAEPKLYHWATWSTSNTSDTKSTSCGCWFDLQWRRSQYTQLKSSGFRVSHVVFAGFSGHGNSIYMIPLLKKDDVHLLFVLEYSSMTCLEALYQTFTTVNGSRMWLQSTDLWLIGPEVHRLQLCSATRPLQLSHIIAY